MRGRNYYVYILTNKHCSTVYIGVTNDLGRRVAEHNLGEVPGFSQRYQLNRLVWFEHFRDIDAAIDRFEDAAEAKPGYAIPFLYLGEAYEKKGKKKQAVKAYQRYVDLYPHAEDGDKVRKKIEKLHAEIDKQKSRRE